VADAEEYVDRAAGRIVEVLDEQHAVVNPELQARIPRPAIEAPDSTSTPIM